ncbi:MAG: outer membrane receptor protein involved in Fe transport [Polyangiales bacterium]
MKGCEKGWAPLALVTGLGLSVVVGLSVIGLSVIGLSASAFAQDPEPGPPLDEEDWGEDDDYEYGTQVAVDPNDGEAARDSRSRSRVTRREFEERLPQSAPEALRFEPGVSVQQTAHGQASPFVRAMTGQQVVHLFDGVRMNNGVYRQGPNQYFFSIDSLTLERMEVVRGSASTRYGSDALGGAILARSIAPTIDSDLDGVTFGARALARFGSADLAIGGRAEVEAQLGRRTAVILGGGYRDVGQLESGGVVANAGRAEPLVPRFEEDGRTQQGTGFREATFDGRFLHQVTEDLTFSAALFGYRQFDAPRTDQCPAPEAPASECLRIEEQFRTLGYVALRGDAGALRDIELNASWQRHSEKRVRDRPQSLVQHQWNNRVDTLGVSFRAASRRFQGARSWRLRFGAEAYSDSVRSDASQSFTDLDRTFDRSRGQYIDGSRYVSLGAFTEVDVSVASWLSLRVGGRAAVIGARAAADPESGSLAVRETWFAPVARFGAEFRVADPVSIFVNVDQGFRAPNLDDLTSRQQVGPGFQFENAALTPERATTIEIGGVLDHDWIELSVWGYATLLRDGIFRGVREASDCPPQTPSCGASRTQFQLLNADAQAVILGTEGGATLHLPAEVTLRATYQFAWSEGPNTGAAENADARVPLSRTPPPGGTLEGRWLHAKSGVYVGAAVLWAAAQRRLAPSDEADARIPVGGTPGYGLVDLRVGYRNAHFRAHLVFQNVFDAAYRVHGSSINGPGRSIRLALGTEI